MTPKVGMHCTVVYGKSLGVPLNILGSVVLSATVPVHAVMDIKLRGHISMTCYTV